MARQERNILERAAPNLSVQAVGFGPGSGRAPSVGECSLRSYTRSEAGA